MFHRVTLIGRVGQEPQMRYTPEGTPVTSFSVATTTTLSKQTPGGGERPCPNGWKESYNGRNWELTTWWRVTCWRGLAETVNTYVNKGMQVFVEGEVAGDAVNVRMTLTSPNCPVAGSMPAQVECAIKALDGVNEVCVELTWDPPWDSAGLSDETRLALGLL